MKFKQTSVNLIYSASLRCHWFKSGFLNSSLNIFITNQAVTSSSNLLDPAVSANAEFLNLPTAYLKYL